MKYFLFQRSESYVTKQLSDGEKNVCVFKITGNKAEYIREIYNHLKFKSKSKSNMNTILKDIEIQYNSKKIEKTSKLILKKNLDYLDKPNQELL